MPIFQPPLLKSITYHAWNKDRTQVAVSPNNEQVFIYDTKGKENLADWGEPVHVLNEHSGFVSAIDWNPKTNLIVTSGHDRNAYVWKYDESSKDWKQTLVILRINRAATGVKWSPNGDKFAVTSGAKCVPVCHFEESNNWWISKMIKGHKSTVLTLDWCPNNKFVVTGATDFKCRIFSAFIKNIDNESDDGYGSLWPKQHEFGECLAEFDQAKAWVNGVSWAPNGWKVAFVGHGSTLHTVDLKNVGSKSAVQTIFSRYLPYLNVQFLSDNSLLATGFDSNPTVYVNTGSDDAPQWVEKERLDKEGAGEEKKDEKAGGAGFGSAFAKFKQADTHGQKFGAAKTVDEAKTYHKNTITGVQLVQEGGKTTGFTTSGIDGRVLFWDLKGVAGL